MQNRERLMEIIIIGEILLQQAEHLEPNRDEILWEVISWEDEMRPIKEGWYNDALFFLEDELGSQSKAYRDFEASYHYYCRSIDDEIECVKEGLAVLRAL